MIIVFENLIDKMQDMLCSLFWNWWVFVLCGVFVLIIVVLVFVMFVELFLVFMLVFGVFVFVDGVFGFVVVICNICKGEYWGWLMFSGILGIVMGVVVVVLFFVVMFVFVIFFWVSIVFWFVFLGVFEIVVVICL